MDNRIAILGLGYVGLPLALEFSKVYNTIGFDINSDRVNNLKSGLDKTGQFDSNELLKSDLHVSFNLEDIKGANIYIITVPTPIDLHNNPDLSYLAEASKLVGKLIQNNNIIVFESTVYPGCTEEFCIPIIEKHSNLKYKQDFHCGYSPERISPGSENSDLKSIVKVVSGSSKKTTDKIYKLYDSIIDAGIYRAQSIKVAEASKVVENCQRDLNISLMNELALIFDRLDVDTNDVLDAAETKWNFSKFRPGLVGGHCISVDPYYLTYIAKSTGYFPEIISSGRRINNNMHKFISSKFVKLMSSKGIGLENATVLLFGVSYKPNCPDIRNSKVFDLYFDLKQYGLDIDIYDPIVSSKEVELKHGVRLVDNCRDKYYDGLIIAVPHDEFNDKNYLNCLKDDKNVVFDVYGVLDKNLTDCRL